MTSQTFHFISGLPRSGSTLLSAILRQNPRFHAGMPTSKVFRIVAQAEGTKQQAMPQTTQRVDPAQFANSDNSKSHLFG